MIAITAQSDPTVVHTHRTSIQPNTEKPPSLKLKTSDSDTIKQAADDTLKQHKVIPIKY